MALNEQRTNFVEYYTTVAAGNGAKAYRLAYPLCKSGHSANASRLLNNDSVKKAILERKQQIRHENKDKINQLIDDWQSLATRSQLAGDRTTEARCYENLSKHFGFYAEDNKQKAEQVQLTMAIKAEAERIGVLLLREGVSQATGQPNATAAMADSPIAAIAGSTKAQQ